MTKYTFTLPITLGLTTYRPSVYKKALPDGTYHLKTEIEVSKISMLQQKSNGVWKFRSHGSDWTLDDLGKEVFLNENDATIALKNLAEQVIASLV